MTILPDLTLTKQRQRLHVSVAESVWNESVLDVKEGIF